MKVNISMGNPFPVALYSAAVLAIGWSIGAHWSHTLKAGCMIFVAVVFLLVHDAVVAILLAIADAKVMRLDRK